MIKAKHTHIKYCQNNGSTISFGIRSKNKLYTIRVYEVDVVFERANERHAQSFRISN